MSARRMTTSARPHGHADAADADEADDARGHGTHGMPPARAWPWHPAMPPNTFAARNEPVLTCPLFAFYSLFFTATSTLINFPSRTAKQ